MAEKKEKKQEHSREFLERKTLIELQREADEWKFKMKKELLLMERENNRLFHEKELERGRIKRAEERKLMNERHNLRKY